MSGNSEEPALPDEDAWNKLWVQRIGHLSTAADLRESLGLKENATPDQVQEALTKRDGERRAAAAEEIGMPEDSGWNAIRERLLVPIVEAFNLPKGSSWEDVEAVYTEEKRIQLAREIGLPDETHLLSVAKEMIKTGRQRSKQPRNERTPVEQPKNG